MTNVECGLYGPEVGDSAPMLTRRVLNKYSVKKLTPQLKSKLRTEVSPHWNYVGDYFDASTYRVPEIGDVVDTKRFGAAGAHRGVIMGVTLLQRRGLLAPTDIRLKYVREGIRDPWGYISNEMTTHYAVHQFGIMDGAWRTWIDYFQCGAPKELAPHQYMHFTTNVGGGTLAPHVVVKARHIRPPNPCPTPLALLHPF